MDGFEMFEKLKNNKKTKPIPLIFLSSLGTKKDVKAGMNLGAEDYLTKPITLTVLMNAVENIV